MQIRKVRKSKDIALNEFKYPISTCWDKFYLPLTIDLKGDNFTGRHRPGLNFSLFHIVLLFKQDESVKHSLGTLILNKWVFILI